MTQNMTVSALNIDEVISLIEKLDIHAPVFSASKTVTLPNGFAYTQRCFEIKDLNDMQVAVLQKRLRRYRNIKEVA